MVVGRTHGNPLDSPTYSMWDSGIGWTAGYEWLQGHMEIHWTVLPILHGTVGWDGQLDMNGCKDTWKSLPTHMYPTWDSGIGWTVGYEWL